MYYSTELYSESHTHCSIRPCSESRVLYWTLLWDTCTVVLSPILSNNVCFSIGPYAESHTHCSIGPYSESHTCTALLGSILSHTRVLFFRRFAESHTCTALFLYHPSQDIVQGHIQIIPLISPCLFLYFLSSSLPTKNSTFRRYIQYGASHLSFLCIHVACSVKWLLEHTVYTGLYHK
jgi:hypothetical protein